METKEKEIEALKKLVDMGGYFAEYFGGDLEKMCENIRNDFPIELGTEFNGSVERLEQRHRETVQKHADEILDLCDTLLCVHAETGNARLYERAVEKLGKNGAIARKHTIGLEITRKEVDHLITQIKLQS